MTALFVFIVGAIIGSFVGALSYRLPRNIKISKGRSYCPKCKIRISAYHNIPILSYLILRGKCADCGKKISPRYPLIEILTASIFLVIFTNLQLITSTISWLSPNLLSLTFLLFIAFIMITILVVDLEHQIIPDELIFAGLAAALLTYFYSGADNLYVHLLSGFAASASLLTINILTLGKGMGLGDVKLAIFIGFILGPALSLAWLFLSFWIGAAFAVVLLITGKAKFGSKIAFGPFLVISFFAIIMWGGKVYEYIWFQ